jgi:hypothetical protein
VVALVGFCGSRSLGSSFAALVSSVVSSVLAAGRSVAVGCAAGADAAVLSAALPLVSSPSPSGPALRVFAAFGPGGLANAGSASAVALVSRAAAAAGSPGHGVASPVSVSWWAGGGPGVPLRGRLLSRSLALVSAVAGSGPGAGLVVFAGSPVLGGSGSWAAALAAVGAGLPVVVFPCGFSPACLPSLGPGSWVPAGSGVWSGGWRWVPAAVQLSFL